ncbi:MAG: hypothetical protein R3F37_13315 [Candidatus Competibacteraceae bacterium]
MPVKTNKVTMRLTLPDDPQVLLKSFPAKLRSQIRRAQKERMVAIIGRLDQLDHFYAVFSQNMRDLGTPVYPKLFFRSIHRAFPKATWIGTVFTKDGLPVASGVSHQVQEPFGNSLGLVPEKV